MENARRLVVLDVRASAPAAVQMPVQRGEPAAARALGFERTLRIRGAVSRCRMNVESSLDGTDSRRTCALDVFVTVRSNWSSSITRIAPPNSWLPINEQITNAATRTAKGIPVRGTQAPNASVPTAISIRTAPACANRMAWALSRSMSPMTESRRKMVFVMCSFTRPYARESTGRCFGRSPRARPPAWNRCRPPYRSR